MQHPHIAVRFEDTLWHFKIRLPYDTKWMELFRFCLPVHQCHINNKCRNIRLNEITIMHNRNYTALETKGGCMRKQSG